VITASPLDRVESPESDVQIWAANIDSLRDNETAELAALLDVTERGRAAQFHFERDRQHYITVRGLLRELLGAALEQPASAITFEYGAKGKPKITGCDRRNLRFNVSHSAGWAIFALAWDREVGIDLEAATGLEKNENLFDLASRVLSQRELIIWHALPDDAARRAAFLRAWTRKEAYIKAIGEGFAERLETIEVALDAAKPKSSLTLHGFPPGEEKTRDWILYDLSAPIGFAAALAIEAQM
jgi:4'-phosphopantetheinyl transferase